MVPVFLMGLLNPAKIRDKVTNFGRRHNPVRLKVFSSIRSILILGILGLVSLIMAVQNQKRVGNIYHQDAAGYYLYLPSAFIYDDLRHPSFHTEMDALRDWYLLSLENGRTLNKYSMGVAILELPFFALAHTVALVSSYPADGYSLPYQMGGVLSNVFWVFIGLFLLRRFLLSQGFQDRFVLLTLVGLCFGTNLYYYTIYEPGMSHGYSFFLFSGLLYFSERLFRLGRKGDLLALALCSGWILVTRPANFPVLLLPLLWCWSSPKGRNWVNYYWRTREGVLIASIAVFLFLPLVQITYWYWVSGSFFVDTYPNEFFDFRNPNLLKGLFSFRKGWWVYTPLAFMAFFGFIPFFRSQPKRAGSILLIMSLGLYITFSWRMWWYGGSFGCRPMVEYLALLSLPFTYLAQGVFGRKRIWLSGLFLTFLLLFTALNLFQSYQYSRGIIHWDRMTRSYYFKVFGRTDIDPADYKQYLISEKDYWAEMTEISNPK